MTHQYSPETLALLADIIAGNVCPDCGASDRLQHFDECVRHPENGGGE